MTLNVAILGAGQAGTRHIDGFGAVEDVRITAVADADPDLVRREAERCGATPFQDWRDALDGSPAPDAVVVALPHHLHAEAACRAADQGLHVLMEKPMGSTLAEGQRIEDACRTAGVLLLIGFVHRFRDEAIRAKAWIDDGLIGVPINCLEAIASPRGAHLGAWVNSPDLSGGGTLLYTGVHALDRLLWLVDSPLRHVQAATRTLTAEARVEEAVTALLTFNNGAMATFNVTGPTYPAGGTAWRTEIYGTEGVIRMGPPFGGDRGPQPGATHRSWQHCRSRRRTLQLQASGRGVCPCHTESGPLTDPRTRWPERPQGVRHDLQPRH